MLYASEGAWIACHRKKSLDGIVRTHTGIAGVRSLPGITSRARRPGRISPRCGKHFLRLTSVGNKTVFNIKGNDYRLIVHILYDKGIIYIQHLLTHAEYDKGAWKA